MRAIETRYKGRLFRSRLEARYAVLFDALGIQAWEYEPEGFTLDSGERYLPDFWLPIPDKPGGGYWVEVKPFAPSDAELRKLTDLAAESGHYGWFLWGQPGEGQALAALKDSSPSPHRWCAPVTMCSTRPLNASTWRDATQAALSARFEFGAQRRATT